MKKIIFLFAAAAVALFTVSCNKNESTPWGTDVGSLEINDRGGVTLIGSEGKIVNRLQGVALPTSSDLAELNLNRCRYGFSYQFIEGITSTTNDTLQVNLLDGGFLPTYLPSLIGSVSYNDPLLMLTSYVEPGRYDFQPTIHTYGNYLDIGCLLLLYTENKESDEDYSRPEFGLEIDPEIILSSNGTSPDTISMDLKFFNNRDDSEKISDGDVWPYRLSFDLQDVPDDIDIPIQDETEKNVTYIVKLNYKAYTNGEYPNDEEITDTFVTCKWTPGDPYGQNNN